MLLPEEFSISANGGVKGIIQRISFWGGYYEAEVLVNDIKILVRMMRNEWEVVEEVYVF